MQITDLSKVLTMQPDVVVALVPSREGFNYTIS